MTKIIGTIPARYKSSRLEGKPLAMIGEKTMIQMVYERCKKSKLLDRVIVATDDQRIVENVQSFNGEAVMTGKGISTGTDRCYEAVKDLDYDIIVNIQGDEPLINPGVIDACIHALIDSPDAVCSTPVVITDDEEEINSKATAKVALNRNFEALYFSRLPIPCDRDKNRTRTYYKHIGLYCFRKFFLKEFVKLEQTPCELSESLEQLRILENGYKIKCCLVDYESYGVDTQEDLIKVRKMAGV